MSDVSECIWCEDGEGGVDDEELNDPDYDTDVDSTNWVRYGPCNNCKAYWVIGTKFTAFSEVTEKGDPRKSVEEGCHNCEWETFEQENPEKGCQTCKHNDKANTKNKLASTWEGHEDE